MITYNTILRSLNDEVDEHLKKCHVKIDLNKYPNRIFFFSEQRLIMVLGFDDFPALRSLFWIIEDNLIPEFKEEHHYLDRIEYIDRLKNLMIAKISNMVSVVIFPENTYVTPVINIESIENYFK
jgi:hypothetical protein